MLLTIDAGNSRIKCALWQDGAIAAGQRTDHRHGPAGEPLELLAGIEDWGLDISRVVACSVAGAGVDAAIEAWCRRNRLPAPHWFATAAACCGVTHGYAQPSQHGADRWAAVIGAWHLYREAACIIDAGTAVTADLLAADACHAGGCIMPGLDMMRDALAARTAGIPAERGNMQIFATNTADAVTSGCWHAQAGGVLHLVEAARQQLGAAARIVLTGGMAGELEAALRPHHELTVEPDLVMHGLRRYAGQG